MGFSHKRHHPELRSGSGTTINCCPVAQDTAGQRQSSIVVPNEVASPPKPQPIPKPQPAPTPETSCQYKSNSCSSCTPPRYAAVSHDICASWGAQDGICTSRVRAYQHLRQVPRSCVRPWCNAFLLPCGQSVDDSPLIRQRPITGISME